MSLFRQKKRVATFPPQIALPLDYTNKLVRNGMVVCTPFNGVAKFVNARNYALSTVGGQAFAGVTTGYWKGAQTKVVSALDVFTLGCVVSFRTTTFSPMTGEIATAANDAVKLHINEGGQTASVAIAYIRNTAGTLQRIVGSTTINDGRPHTVMLVKRAANDWSLYVDGNLDGTSSTNLPGSGFTNAAPLYICGNPTDNTGPSGSQVVMAFAIPNYAYTSAEVNDFSRNPWQIFALPSRRFGLKAASAAAGFFARYYYDMGMSNV